MRVAVVIAAVAALLGATLTPGWVVRHAEVRAPQPVVIVKIKYKVEVVTRLARLQSDLAIGPGTFDAEIDFEDGTITGVLWLPPAYGYFVVFGFVPTTSRVDLIPAGEGAGRIQDGQVKINVKVFVKLGEVAVDRQPLDVGQTCQTAEPASIDLEGPFGLDRMVLKGVYPIPSFGGCQGRERLDPLMTGLVSGPGNTIEVTLTALPSTP
ncbi:hypothetical protein [Saccharothrix deserti]|uniref:hypothetical protein n=1 Tax=Saccharothrix deserti TaxID=2593674 RepID=UPI00131CB095|nr:hypothetical protein [Saccharothrix deserti]